MRARLVLVLLATALTVAGCTGGGSTPNAQQTERPARQAGGASFDRIPGIVDRLRPSVVTVRTPGGGAGSGVVYSRDGVIVTNQHVVARGQGPEAGEFDEVTVVLATGERATARVVGADYRTDIAALRVDRDGLRAAEFQQSLPEVGELAVAIGSPLGFNESVTVGVISGLNRNVPAGQTQRPLINLIQTDAPISPGSSGGALVNEEGAVVGISELYIPPQAGAVSIGFAIPSATVVDVTRQILRTGEVRHAFFGVSLTAVTPPLAEQLGLRRPRGLLVREVLEGSGAAEAGIRPGDVIVGLGGNPVGTVDEFQTRLRNRDPGGTVTVTVLRDGQRQRFDVTLTDRPDS